MIKYFLSNECKENAVSYEAYCEHCGDLGEDTPAICDGGTWWCKYCWGANNGDIPENLPAKRENKDEM